MDFYVSAPGKVILHGEHAVVYGKKALATAVNLRTYMRIITPEKSLEDARFVLDIRDLDWSCDLPLADLTALAAADDLRSAIVLKFQSADRELLTLALLAFITLYKGVLPGGLPQGLQVRTSSHLPFGGGLGSSAAFSTCAAAGLLALGGQVTLTESGTFSPSDLDLINSWAFEGEKVIHGRPSGVDNNVTTYGGLIGFQTGTLRRLALRPGRAATIDVLVTSTGKSRSTKALVARVADLRARYPKVVDSMFDTIDALTTECERVLTVDVAVESDAGGERNTETGREAGGVVGEGGIKKEAGLDGGEVSGVAEAERTIADCFHVNQCLLEAVGVGSPEIADIRRLVSGVCDRLKTKITGAGGGGCVITYVPSECGAGRCCGNSKGSGGRSSSSGGGCCSSSAGGGGGGGSSGGRRCSSSAGGEGGCVSSAGGGGGSDGSGGCVSRARDVLTQAGYTCFTTTLAGPGVLAHTHGLPSDSLLRKPI